MGILRVSDRENRKSPRCSRCCSSGSLPVKRIILRPLPLGGNGMLPSSIWPFSSPMLLVPLKETEGNVILPHTPGWRETLWEESVLPRTPKPVNNCCHGSFTFRHIKVIGNKNLSLASFSYLFSFFQSLSFIFPSLFFSSCLSFFLFSNIYAPCHVDISMTRDFVLCILLKVNL